MRELAPEQFIDLRAMSRMLLNVEIARVIGSWLWRSEDWPPELYYTLSNEGA